MSHQVAIHYIENQLDIHEAHFKYISLWKDETLINDHRSITRE